MPFGIIIISNSTFANLVSTHSPLQPLLRLPLTFLLHFLSQGLYFSLCDNLSVQKEAVEAAVVDVFHTRDFHSGMQFYLHYSKNLLIFFISSFSVFFFNCVIICICIGILLCGTIHCFV